MTNFFNFLNAQNGDRLAGYAIVFLIALSIIVNGIYKIIWAFRKPTTITKKPEKTEQ
jgi:uncharacterized membrane protein HdeD (DUF308 family)